MPFAVAHLVFNVVTGVIAIVFISDTTFSRREEQAADLQWLREACTRLVEAVKDTAQLQENLVHYVGAEIQDMRKVYDRLRVQIALTIRELEEMRESEGGVIDVLGLDSLKLLVDEEHRRINQTTTELVAKRGITPSMGSSLINDSVYARDIAMNLVQAAQVLFATSERDHTQAAHDVVLEKDELERLGAQAGMANPNS